VSPSAGERGARDRPGRVLCLFFLFCFTLFTFQISNLNIDLVMNFTFESKCTISNLYKNNIYIIIIFIHIIISSFPFLFQIQIFKSIPGLSSKLCGKFILSLYIQFELTNIGSIHL
jgi:hypothetical protein